MRRFSNGFLRGAFVLAFLLSFPSCGEKPLPEVKEVVYDEDSLLDFIFNNQTLGSTTITIKRSEWDKLCDYYRFFYKNENYVRAESYEYEKDGKSWRIEDVGFRLRGNTSRFCPQGVDNGREQGQRSAEWNPWYFDNAEKENNNYRQTHFKVDFGKYLPGEQKQKMAGRLDGMALKRLDHSLGREIFCYDLFRRYGIWTAPRASHTRLTINIIEDNGDGSVTKVNYGVYEMFEEVGKPSLMDRAINHSKASNAWSGDNGNLWKCAYYGTDSASALTDSSGRGMGVEKNVIVFDEDGNPSGKIFETYDLDLKTNKKKLDEAKSEFCAFIRELNGLPKLSVDEARKNPEAVEKIRGFYEKWFDVDFFIRTYAINILLGMDDDYWNNANNYYLYFDTASGESTGKVYFIPFDYDNSLGCSISEGGFKQNPLDWGRGQDRPLMDRLLSVPEYRAKFKKCLREVSSKKSLWNFDSCSARFKAWADMLKPYVKSKDLSYVGMGGHSFEDYTWQPEGYSLLDRENNVFDATRESINKWLD